MRRSLALVSAVLLLLLGTLSALGGALVTSSAAQTALLVAAGVHLVASSALTVGIARRRRPLLQAGLTWLAVLTAAALYSSCSAWTGCGWQLAVALVALGYLFLTLAAVLRYYHSLRPSTEGAVYELPYSHVEEPDSGTEMAPLRKTAEEKLETGESVTDALVNR